MSGTADHRPVASAGGGPSAWDKAGFDDRWNLVSALERESIRYPEDRLDEAVLECLQLREFLRIVRAQRNAAPSRARP